MKKSYLVAVAIVAGIALYVSPYVSVHNLKKAAEEGDAVALGDHVDFPAVRESLRGTMNVYMTRELSALKDNPFAAFGAMMVTTMVDKMVDSMVTPQGIAALMTRAKGVKSPESGEPQPVQAETGSPPRVERGYKGWDRFEVKVTSADQQNTMTATLRRENLFFWKLKNIDIQMPSN